MAEDGGAYRGPSRLELILLVVAVAGIAAGALLASGILPLGSNSDEAATVLLTGIYPGATTPPPSPTAAQPPNRCPGQATSRHQPSRRCPPPPRLHRLGILLSRRPSPHRSPLLLLQQRPGQRSQALPHCQLSSLLCSRANLASRIGDSQFGADSHAATCCLCCGCGERHNAKQCGRNPYPHRRPV